MTVLRQSQIEDLQELHTICQEQGVDVVVIGAIAYRLFVDDEDRQTRDVDLAVALEMGDLSDFVNLLEGHGWQRDTRNEERWKTRRGSWMDLLPAGPKLRETGKLVWPESGHVMSLAGFAHVFSDSILVELAPGFRFKVIPPPVLALIKMSSYLDDPHRRAKDLVDIRRLLRAYGTGTERIFSPEVFAAELPEIEFASALLLGLDMRQLATPQEIELIESFLRAATPLEDAPALDFEGRQTEHFKQQLAAFAKGFYRDFPSSRV